MNDENSAKQTNPSKLSKEKKGQKDNKSAASEPNEVKKLQESFDRVYNGPNKLRHEYDLRFEAQQLGMEIGEYRRWYELSSESSTWYYRFWRWAGFREKKLWDFLPIIIVPLVVIVKTLSDTCELADNVFFLCHAN
jgi:hypothetical protein